MNREEIQNEINEIKLSIDKLNERLDSAMKAMENCKEYWTPEHGNKYYYISPNGEILDTFYNERSVVDKERIGNLNAYKTEEEAEMIAFKELLERKLIKYAYEHNDKEMDWEDADQEKYCIQYGYGTQSLIVVASGICKNIGQVYFTSKEIARKALDEYKDDLLKYYGKEKI